MSWMNEILSVGHSTQPYEDFLRLLRMHDVTAIADVRSAPYSRRFPHFNRETLRDELRIDQIAYVFLGDMLGGRPKNSRFFCDNVADYEQMATAAEFRRGLDRVVDGAKRYRIALMCSEHDPLDCHRCLLIGRALKGIDLKVSHILANGSLKTQANIEEDLLALCGQNQSQADIFASYDERLASAYRDRAKRVAYAIEPPLTSQATAAE